jgi:1-acyl-sn-glycerol-3-phosphate acyltransferase
MLSVGLVLLPITFFCGWRLLWAAFRRAPNLDCLCDVEPRRWVRTLLWAAGVDVVLENPERIDVNRPQILIANHVGWFDVLALADVIPGKFVFVAKKELARVPIFGAAVHACGHIFVDRQDRAKAVASLEVARRQLERHHPTVVIFPEGTRSRDGELLPFKRGAFVLALQTGAELVPAFIEGSREVMKPGSLLIDSGTVRVRLGDPISVSGLELSDRNKLTRIAREAVRELGHAGANETD